MQERERFRVKFDTKDEYNAYFDSDECNRLFDETIGAKLATSEILQLLEDQPRSTGEIAEAMGLTASEVAKYMKDSSRQGLARYDEELKRYVAA